VAEVSAPKTADAKSDLAARLVDEYKILQDKIDKIGAFRFTIKGWSITVIIASIFAGSATRTVPRSLWAISLIFFLVVFFFYERQQTNLRYRFGQRVLTIEAVLSRLLRSLAHESGSQPVTSSFLTVRFVPGIGHIGARTRTGRKRAHRRNFWRSCMEADGLFYFAQIAAVVTFLFWPAGVQRQGQTSSDGIVINNTVPVPTADFKGQQHATPAQTNSGRGNEKDARKNKKNQSH